MAKKTRASKILVIIGVITLICILSCAISWYFPLDPVSPPETRLDESPSFNALFEDADDEWMFLFRKNDKYYLSDIYGQEDEVILDIVSVTNSPNAELLDHESISPNDRFLAVNFFVERDPSTEWGPPLGKLLIFDLRDHSVIDIPASLDGFEIIWRESVYWLDSNVFLVAMRKLVSYPEEISFLVFDLRNLNNPKLIEFDPCELLMLFYKDTCVLVVSDEWCTYPDEVHYWAIDLQGKRLANSDEIEYYNSVMSDDYLLEESKEFSLCEGCPTIKTEPVSDWTPSVDDLDLPWLEVLLAGRFNYNNYWRDYIYLDDKLVRTTDIELGRLLWDSDLQLFVFNEGYQDYWFLMDIYGHYRLWYEGEYIGKIPKTILINE